MKKKTAISISDMRNADDNKIIWSRESGFS